MATSLDFWFDYTCPYAYLGSTQVRAVASRLGARLAYQPILLGGIFKAVNQPQNLFASRGPARIAYEAADMQRWARIRGVTLKMPANHPMRSVEALRATIAVHCDPAVIDGFYRAYWVDNREISSPEVMTDVLTKAGHDAPAVLARLDSLKDDLRARTERGIALGIFGVPAWVVDGSELHWGQDRIAHVEGRRFEPGPDGPVPSAKTLHVFWDFSSPFAYFGASQVEAVARRTGAIVKWHPVLLGGMFRSLGGPDIPLAGFSPPKAKWVADDLARWAKYWNLPFRWPSRFPVNSLKALRLYLALPEDRRGAFRDAAMRAAWADDEDLTDEAVLERCVGDADIAKTAFAKIGSDEIKSELRAANDRALAKGVFGVPTFFVESSRGASPGASPGAEEMFWGQDRLDLVEDALRT